MRWVVKTGSAILSRLEGGLDRAAVMRIAAQLIALRQNNHEVILVSSGAVAAGLGRLGIKDRPTDLRLKQSAAAVGQLSLMEAYEEAFSKAGVIPAQILLTREDLLHRERYLNIRTTLMTLLSLGTLPILNENDSVSTDEIQFGDNDTLAAIVAAKVGADRLVLLSDVDGFYEAGTERSSTPTVIPVIERITDQMERAASKTVGSAVSTGGIAAKVKAARTATSAGVETWIASGRRADTLAAIDQNRAGAGTRFAPRPKKFVTRHAWIAFGRSPKGALLIDDGAAKALIDGRKSLLAKGVRSVRGSFLPGDMVAVKSASAGEIARGLVNFSAVDLKRLRGRHSSEIPAVLGRAAAGEVIHRDNLVLL